MTNQVKTMYLAGGCFWCSEAAYASQPGVLSVIPGYMSDQVVSKREGIRIEYNSNQISYAELLAIYWKNIDPTDAGGQFYDRGSKYQTAIYFSNPQEQQIAIASKKDLANSGIFTKPIVTEILPAGSFKIADEAHHQYYLKHPQAYKHYKYGSGRVDFLTKTWSNDD